MRVACTKYSCMYNINFLISFDLLQSPHDRDHRHKHTARGFCRRKSNDEDRPRPFRVHERCYIFSCSIGSFLLFVLEDSPPPRSQQPGQQAALHERLRGTDHGSSTHLQDPPEGRDSAKVHTLTTLWMQIIPRFPKCVYEIHRFSRFGKYNA